MVIRYIYSFFLGALLAVFIGVGIAAFYKEPKAPDYPIMTSFKADGTLSASDAAKQREFEISSREYQKRLEPYNRNVSILATISAVLFVVISLVLLEKILILSDGILLGGLFTLVYAIIRGFVSTDEMFRFFVVTVGLAVALFVGYWKFVKNNKKLTGRK